MSVHAYDTVFMVLPLQYVNLSGFSILIGLSSATETLCSQVCPCQYELSRYINNVRLMGLETTKELE